MAKSLGRSPGRGSSFPTKMTQSGKVTGLSGKMGGSLKGDAVKAAGFQHKHTSGLGKAKMEGSPAIKKNSSRMLAAFRKSIG